MKISILIPIFNNLKFTKICLENLTLLISEYELRSKINNHQIIIIDDGSTDGTSNWIKSNYPNVIILNGDGDYWWSKSVVVGTKYALNTLKSDYILLWNNDIEAHEDYFYNIEKALNEVPSKSILGSSILTKHDRTVISDGMLYNKYTGNRLAINRGADINFIREEYINADLLGGMGTLIPALVFKEIGYWDHKTFPQYAGDTDFTLRAKKTGWNIIVCTKLKLFNDVTNTGMVHNNNFGDLFKSFSSIKSYYNVKITLRFLFRHGFPIISLFSFGKKYFFYIGGFLKSKFQKNELK